MMMRLVVLLAVCAVGWAAKTFRKFYSNWFVSAEVN